MRNYILKVASLVMAMGLSAGSWAVEFRVNDFRDMGDENLEDGACRTKAQTCTLRAAVQQANRRSGTRITLPEGTYELDEEITITSNMKIVGSGPDKVTISGKGANRVFRIRGGAFATITGVGITQGWSKNGGGAIGVWGSSKLVLVDSAVTESFSGGNGAALYASMSVISIENTTMANNRADGRGGAVFVTGPGSWLSVYNGSFERNSSISGGGIYCDSSAYANFGNSKFVGNRSTGNNLLAGGGAIYSRLCSISLNNVTFEQNSAEKRGGALYLSSQGESFVDTSTFTGNSAAKGDGGAIYSVGKLQMLRVTMADNTGWFGSALYDGGSSSLTLVSVVDNTARSSSGGAIYHNSTGDMELDYSTVARNSGGNIVNEAGSLLMTGSLVAGAAGGQDCAGSITSAGYNLDSDGSCALGAQGDVSSVDPLLVAITDGSGYQPGSGSPAVDAGVPDCPDLDIRYHARHKSCDIGALEAGGAVANIGFVEFSQPVTIVRESDGSATITLTRSGGSDGDVSVRYQADATSVAKAGFDFIDFDGVLEWVDGESGDKSFQIEIRVDENTSERIEPLYLSLRNPTGGVALGSNRTATLNIVDGNVQFGELALDEASYVVSEGTGELDITVKRSNGDAGEVSVAYTTVDKEATAGQDYTAVSGTLVFADRESSKTITIPIVQDREPEGDETFTILLSDVTGGATLGSYDSAVVTISDDDTSSSEATGSSGGNNASSASGGDSSSGGGGGGSYDFILLLMLVAISLLYRYSRWVPTSLRMQWRR